MVSADLAEDASDDAVVVICLTLDLVRVAAIHQVHYRLEEQALLTLYLTDGYQ